MSPSRATTVIGIALSSVSRITEATKWRILSSDENLLDSGCGEAAYVLLKHTFLPLRSTKQVMQVVATVDAAVVPFRARMDLRNKPSRCVRPRERYNSRHSVDIQQELPPVAQR